MNEWQAKYEALSLGCSQETIEAANVLVQNAVDISYATTIPFDQVLYEMLRVAGLLEAEKTTSLLSSADDLFNMFESDYES